MLQQSGCPAGPHRQQSAPHRIAARSLVLNRHANVSRLLAIAAVVLGMLSACSSPVVPAKPDPTVVTVSLAATDRINVDARKRANPVVVRLYFLKNAAAFDVADFFSLFDKDTEVLGDAVVAHDEIVLKPGETRTLDPRVAEGAKVLAVLAAFRDVDRAAWRATAPVVANRTNEVTVSLDGTRVTVAARLAAVKTGTK